MIRSVDELFEVCGGPARVGRAIGKSTEHAAAMKRRSSVPTDYWHDLVEWAKGQGLEGVTFDVLGRIHAKAPKSSTPQTAGAPQ